MIAHWHDVVGTLGVALIVGSYLLVQVGRLAAPSLPHSLANALGASLVLVSLAVEPNLAAALLEVFWLLASLLGAARLVAARRARREQG